MPAKYGNTNPLSKESQMKKLLLAVIAVAALFAVDANAYYRRGYNASCGSCPKTRCCERVEEAPCAPPPCCVKYARVTFPATKVKHVSYSWECPSDCSEEAGEIAAQ
jgi:hypothetical protein